MNHLLLLDFNLITELCRCVIFRQHFPYHSTLIFLVDPPLPLQGCPGQVPNQCPPRLQHAHILLTEHNLQECLRIVKHFQPLDFAFSAQFDTAKAKHFQCVAIAMGVHEGTFKCGNSS